jgi:PiT family inorganic phosphate transporter
VVGAVLGIGLIKGVNTVSRKALQQICLAWFLTPVVSCGLSLAIFFAIHLEYVPPR